MDVSITGNSTNPTRFQHPVAGTYKKECMEQGKKYFSVASGGGTGRTLHPDNMAAGPASYGMTDTMGRMHSDAQFAGSSSVPAHVEMMGLMSVWATTPWLALPLRLQYRSRKLLRRGNSKMFTIFFIALLLWFIGSVLRLAIRATWGITKIVFSLVVLPVVAIVAAFAGLMTIALPVLLVVGIITLIANLIRG